MKSVHAAVTRRRGTMPMATTNTSAEQFFEQAQKLSLLHGAALRKAQAEIGDEQEVQTIARKLIRAGIISRWAASQFLKGRSLRWGKYQLIDQIGKELNSPVYLAEHTQMERRVVLKILTEAQASRGELRAVAQLDHRNLVHVYDIDHQNDKYYLVMEYVEGIDLGSIKSPEAKPPVENSAAYIYQAALGLAHAHERGIVHRQIHPGNIMVDHEGVVKVLNLDAARPADMISEAGSKLEQLPQELIDYISPEQASGAGKTDHRSDIYSLGCVFYHLLTGRPPFAAETMAGRLDAHRNATASDIGRVAADVPPPLIEICNKMMAKDPAARYQSATEVATALDQWLTEFEETRRATTIRRKPPVAAVSGIEASGTSPIDRVKPTHKPNLWASLTRQQQIIAASAAGVVALLLLVGVVAALLLSGDDAAVVDKQPQGNAASETADGQNQQRRNGPDEQNAAAKQPPDNGFPEPGALTEDGKPPAEGNPPGAGNPVPPVEPAPENPAPMPEGQPAKPPGEAPQPAPADPQPEVPAPKPEATKPQPNPKPNPKPKPKPPQPAPPAKLEPFKNLPVAVALPDNGSGDAQAGPAPAASLGPVDLPADANLFVSLAGSDVAARGGGQFVVREQDEASPTRKWQIFSVQPDGVEQAVASLGLSDGDLKFQWLPPSATDRFANYLRNCALTLQTADAAHHVRLREPLAVEPITIDLDKPRARTSIDLEWLPEDELVMVEFTTLEGIPTPTWDPGATLAADGGRATLAVGANAERVLLFQVRSEIRRGVQIDLASFFKVDSEPEPMAFSKSLAEREANKLITANNDLTAEINHINGIKDKNRKKAAEPRLKFLQEKQVIANRAIDQFNILKQHYNALNGTGKIHFRVYFQAGGENVVLASSE